MKNTTYKIPTSIEAFYGTDEEAYYQEINTSICHTKYKMKNTKCQIQNTKYKMKNITYKILNTKYRPQ